MTFDKIAYSEDDLGADGSDASKHYTVKEKPASDPSYTYDDTVYDVSVNLHKGTDSAGKTVMTATPSYSKGGAVVSSMAFDNKSNTVTVTGSKVWDDDGNRDSRHAGEAASGMPKTGDGSWALVAGAVLAGCAALTIAMAALRRRGTEAAEKKRSHGRS